MLVSIVGCNGGTGSGREEIELGEHAFVSVGGTGSARTVPALVLKELSIIRQKCREQLI